MVNGKKKKTAWDLLPLVCLLERTRQGESARDRKQGNVRGRESELFFILAL